MDWPWMQSESGQLWRRAAGVVNAAAAPGGGRQHEVLDARAPVLARAVVGEPELGEDPARRVIVRVHDRHHPRQGETREGMVDQRRRGLRRDASPPGRAAPAGIPPRRRRPRAWAGAGRLRGRPRRACPRRSTIPRRRGPRRCVASRAPRSRHASACREGSRRTASPAHRCRGRPGPPRQPGGAVAAAGAGVSSIARSF